MVSVMLGFVPQPNLPALKVSEVLSVKQLHRGEN